MDRLGPVKREIIPQRLVEIEGRYGNSLIVWSGEDLGEKTEGTSLLDDFHKHAKNLTGIYLEHPTQGTWIRHTNKIFKLDKSDCSTIKALPLVTMSELQEDAEESHIQADRVSSRIGNDLAKTIVEVSYSFDNAYLSIQESSKRYFELQDQYLHESLSSLRDTRDTLTSGQPASKRDIQLLQAQEATVQLLYSQADEISEYVRYLDAIASRITELTNELEEQ